MTWPQDGAAPAIRRARPQVDWDAFFPDIHTTRDANGKPIVMVVKGQQPRRSVRRWMPSRTPRA
jgi:hypothetical protein